MIGSLEGCASPRGQSPVRGAWRCVRERLGLVGALGAVGLLLRNLNFIATNLEAISYVLYIYIYPYFGLGCCYGTKVRLSESGILLLQSRSQIISTIYIYISLLRSGLMLRN